MNPVAFEIGQLSIYWYGILIVAGILSGAYVATVQARQRGQDPERVWDALLLCLILGIVGARIYHVFSTSQGSMAGWPYYRENPQAIFKIWEGGLGLIGAIIGGALGMVIYTRLAKLPTSSWLDISAYGLLLAQGVGRWGNYINQELYGPPTTLPWGIPIEASWRLVPYNDIAAYPLDTLFHPLFLYESLWCFLGFGLLWWFSERFRSVLLDGDAFCLYVIWYAVGRGLIEFLRLDAWMFGPIAVAQLFAIAAILAAVAVMVLRHRKNRSRQPGAHSDAENVETADTGTTGTDVTVTNAGIEGRAAS
ncbi:MAG: prolipoprotein diacylglyceryl transferase [Anaerolineae bacterium]|nr:prolipoprotein diacylglyceryl transferase [Anaerolineae bacterium]